MDCIDYIVIVQSWLLIIGRDPLFCAFLWTKIEKQKQKQNLANIQLSWSEMFSKSVILFIVTL